MLKPNLVEYIAGVEVNTNPVLVGAAAEALLQLGAKRVVVGEGPGHQRDTHLVLVESGHDAQLRSQGIEFVDLNRDQRWLTETLRWLTTMHRRLTHRRARTDCRNARRKAKYRGLDEHAYFDQGGTTPFVRA